MSLGQPRQERGGKLGKFAFPLTERRQPETDDTQPIEQIGAKTAGGRQFRQRAVGGGDQPEIGASQPGLAHPPEFPLLERPQQEPLPPRRQFSDLIQKQGATVRGFQKPRAGGIRAGKRSPGMSEELGLQQFVGKRSAVHGNEGLPAPSAAGVQIAGEQFLPGARFPLDEYRYVKAGNPPGFGEQRPHGGRSGDQFRGRLFPVSHVRGRPHRGSPSVA